MQLSLHVPEFESGMCNVMIGWKNFALEMHGLYTCKKIYLHPGISQSKRGIGVCHFIESLLVD